MLCVILYAICVVYIKSPSTRLLSHAAGVLRYVVRRAAGGGGGRGEGGYGVGVGGRGAAKGKNLHLGLFFFFFPSPADI